MKYVRKITPVSSADGEGLESWLEDMALQGLYLKKFRPVLHLYPRPGKKDPLPPGAFSAPPG